MANSKLDTAERSTTMKRPKRDAKWHAMMKRRRELKYPSKNNCGGIQTSHGVSWVRAHILGKGSFGSVFFAAAKTSLPINNNVNPNLPSVMAVKSAEISRSSSLKNEKQILCNLNTSHYVIKCYGDEITKPEKGDEAVHYNILLEFCSGGNLARRIYKSGTGLPEFEVRRYTGDIVRGLCYIHRNGYVHCDIKPSNILLVPNSSSMNVRYEAKIADFGLAKKQSRIVDEDDDYCFNVRGTYMFMSPEVVGDKIQEAPADIWALGCVVIEMMSGKPVWGCEVHSHFDSNIRDLLGRIAYSPESPEIPENVSYEGRDFLEKCLMKDANERWSAEMLSQHPFVCSHFWEDEGRGEKEIS